MVDQTIITHRHLGRLQIDRRWRQRNVDRPEYRLTSDITFSVRQCVEQRLHSFPALEHGFGQPHSDRIRHILTDNFTHV
ncbi:hypothetical protein D3C81_2068760 [compost metagenome]